LVKIAEVRENAEVAQFLPASPEPHLTYPTTTYKTDRVLPRNALPVDYYSINPQRPHWPLIAMLVMTQLSVGTFAIGNMLDGWLDSNLSEVYRPFQSALAAGIGLVALAASTLHLGRPQFAYRAVIGLRHSWLSREIVAFGLFAALSIIYAWTIWFSRAHTEQLAWLGWSVVASGTIAVFCSAMIYVFTRREFWSLNQTGSKFLGTAIVLGIATSWASLLMVWLWGTNDLSRRLVSTLTPQLAGWLIVATMCKLALELSILGHLLDYRTSSLKRSALLLVGPLASSFLARLTLSALGGIVMPLFILSRQSRSPELDVALIVMMLLSWMACFAGELMERSLFFQAVAAPRMPGGPRP
jgi:DMSO reductase anchor subunit